ncbi:MAG: YvcK family protein [Oscillospiraceae bacterium]|nr:YvcK family protein [Oscillospiraceae bacterium]MCL2279031.1 YvcK family protein [Oscillospiraceae bacterium]
MTEVKKAEKSRGPKIVCIGGGTGHANLLRGLKRRTQNITAIVTVSDDGGGSGVLRDELHIPPPGDIRNCMQALSNAEPTIEDLMGYRFDAGSLSGQSFGNLFLAAMNGISNSFYEAVIKMGEVLSITGRVIPVSIDDIHLWATFEDGSMVVGESKIAAAKRARKSRISKVEVTPKDAVVIPECIEAIEDADIIVLGPGSLYTSIIPNLLIDGIVDAIARSDAVKIYVCNIMTEPGETDGYTASEHVKGIVDHIGQKLFDYCIVNSEKIDESILQKYIADGASVVEFDEDKISELGVAIVKCGLASINNSFIRHDSNILAQEIFKLFLSNAPTRLYNG